MKTFVRTTHMNGLVECSWYDKNGRRYKHETTSLVHDDLSSKETDNIYGFMSHARKHGYNIIDNYPHEHPKRINNEQENHLGGED